jgi:hypothetical protein
MAAGFAAILVASASGMGALIWLYRIEKLSQTNAVSALEVTPANAPSAATNAAKTHG